MAAEQLNDKENQFRKRARRRLVGAVALVLLMITLLPMVLDDRSSQKAPQPDIAISIPSQDGTDFSSKIVPVAPQASNEPTATPTPVPMSSPIENPKQPAAAVVPPAEPKAIEKAKPVEAVASPVPNAVLEKPALPKSEPVAMSPKPAIETKPDAVAPVEPRKTSATTAVPTKGSVSVQVGVFSDAAKVKQMRGKIAEKNIQCYTEDMKTPKGVKIRLRCGPYAVKPEAQHALETLKAMGYSGILVTNQ